MRLPAGVPVFHGGRLHVWGPVPICAPQPGGGGGAAAAAHQRQCFAQRGRLADPQVTTRPTHHT